MKAGITGHQDLGSVQAQRWVRETLARLVEDYRVTEGFSCLAAGADQLYAELLISQDIPYTPVLPCRNYEDAFLDEEGRQRFSTLLREVRRIIWLDFNKPSRVAFFEAGKEVVNRSEVLFAVWDGQPARGLGGTADVVAYALARGKPTVHVNPLTRTVESLTKPPQSVTVPVMAI